MPFTFRSVRWLIGHAGFAIITARHHREYYHKHDSPADAAIPYSTGIESIVKTLTGHSFKLKAFSTCMNRVTLNALKSKDLFKRRSKL